MENEKTIRSFLSENKKQIEDYGFSQKVMKSLPYKKNTQWIIPFFSILGFYSSLLYIDLKDILYYINSTLLQSNPLYVVGCLICIPFMCLAIWYIRDNKLRFW